MVARDRIERHRERGDDAEVLVRLPLPFVGVARVALDHVADREDGVRIEPVEIDDRLLQIAQAPVAAHRAVRKDRQPLDRLGFDGDERLPVDGDAAFVSKFRWSRGDDQCRRGEERERCEHHERDGTSGDVKHPGIVVPESSAVKTFEESREKNPVDPTERVDGAEGRKMLFEVSSVSD